MCLYMSMLALADTGKYITEGSLNVFLYVYTGQWRIQDFPEEGAPTLQGGAPTYDFAKISQKLHEIERIWTPGGGRASKILLCRSATAGADSLSMLSHFFIGYFAVSNHKKLQTWLDL